MQVNLLIKLLNDVGLSVHMSDFSQTEIINTVVRKNENELVLELVSKNFINPIVLNKFIEAAKSFFSSTNLIVQIKVESELNIDIINNYFQFYAKTFNFSDQILNILLNRELTYEASLNEVRLSVYNQFEFQTVCDELHKIELQLNLLGISCDFGCVEVSHEIDLSHELEKMVQEASVAATYKQESEVVTVLDTNDLVYGKKIGRVTHKIIDLSENMNNICIEGEVFSVSDFKTKTNKVIVTIMLTDYTDSISGKLFLDTNDKSLDQILSLKGKYIKLAGHVNYDPYERSDAIRVTAISLEQQDLVIDKAENKRVELHVHTNMSAVDSVIDAGKLVDYCLTNNYEAVAVVDHNNIQSFPTLFNKSKHTDLKVVYGVEFNVVDDNVNIMFNNNTKKIHKYDDTYVVFDFETTGLSAFNGDKIIEFGAVKMCNGKIIDTFDKLANPGVEISTLITELTGIKNSMLVGKPSEEIVLKEFKTWISDHVLVAHNANFDYNFLQAAYNRFNLGNVDNTIIDTLELSRVLHPEWGRHGLAALIKRYKIPLDNHHRACHDATATAKLFDYQLKEVLENEIEFVSNINDIVDTEEIFKFGKITHVTLLVKNNVGLKNLFKLVSLANTKYFFKEPRLLKSEIDKFREGILVGSSCVNGEIFTQAQKLDDLELANLMKFYDYIEVQPPLVYEHLVQIGEFDNITSVMKNIKKIVNVGLTNDKIVIGSGDVHHLQKRDKILREIIINNPAPGGGYHKLKTNRISEIPSQHFRTTNEMLEEFSFLGEQIANDIVITNPKTITKAIERVQIIKDELFTPKLENSDIDTKNMVYANARKMYGEQLPEIVNLRIEKELKSIIGHGFDVIYLISSKLVTKSLNDGYLVGSRGSVGSSLVATFMDITEVNPLPPHYICPKCKYSEFINDEKYACGYDLPAKVCPSCGEHLIGEGHDIPFETFLGFDGDKVPDIDLNFSGDYQSKAHDYTKELFGEDYVFRAGTISTIAEKTAFGYVKGYEKDKDLNFRNAELTRLSSGCQGVKRGTGQHPGGIIVVPNYMDIYDFTPIQYPADDITSSWKTTHFDFHAIHDNVLKLDILGHDDPTILHMLDEISGINSRTVDFTKKEVVSIFNSAKALGVEPLTIKLSSGATYTLFATGTLGVPEFGTRFVIEMLKDTQPKSFAELVKISGLSHGTDVWINNAQNLMKNQTCEFREIIGCRDDIMVYLMHKNLDPVVSFKIMEDVRKGKGLTSEYVEIMKKNDVPDWYINSCNKIKYMFPKAHASAYVLMAMRIAYFKVFHPIYFYATYFSIRAGDFDIHTMIKGKDAVLERIEEILNKEYEATPKEKNTLGTLEIALEMLERGLTFANIDLDKSDATKFKVENNSLIPPFNSVDGLGTNVAINVVNMREERPFMSIEDLKKRGKINKTILTKLEIMDVLEHLPEGDQLTLF